MTIWNEKDHPRDDIGRFTFKEGGGGCFSSDNFEMKENPKDILYKLSKDKEDKVKYRNKLIDILGDKMHTLH